MMETGTDKILSRIKDGVAWLTINNPERRNAISLEMWERIGELAAIYDADDAVRVVVLTGAGDKAFASGADISQFEESRSNAEASERYTEMSAGAREQIGNLRKPVIAMIRGFCLGGGIALALKADLRIASTDAQFGIPAAKLGLAYGFDGLRALTNLVGPSIAKEFLFTARRFSAPEALRFGLVNRVTEASELESVVQDAARMIAENAPLTIQSAKLTINEILKDPNARDMAALDDLKRVCMDSQDYAEGRRAFMEKLKPVFFGR